MVTVKFTISTASSVNITIDDASDAASYFDNYQNDPESTVTDWIMSNEDSGDVTLPVELSTFTAQFLNDEARLYWVTQTEQDNVGWNVYRNAEYDMATASRINEELIPGHGTTSEPQSYNYTDHSLETEIAGTYYYWIENLDLGGASAIYGPQELIVEPGNEPGPDIPEDVEPGIYRVENNPFRASTGSRVHFYLDKSSKVELGVYNIKGQLIKTLHTGPAKTGDCVWHGTDSHGSNPGTGVYLYVMKVNGKIFDTQKVILVR